MGKLTAKTGSGSWAPCPEGQYQAVCVDVVDLGWLERTFEGKSTGFKPMIQLVWQVDEHNEEGQPYLVFSKRYVLSLDPKANLRKDLDAWFGPKTIEKKIAEDDLETEDFVGKNAYINVVHNEGSDGTLYANIGALMPLPKNMTPMQSEGYTRRCDRDDWAEKAPDTSAFDTYIAPRQDDMSTSNSQRAAVLQPVPATSTSATPNPRKHPAATNGTTPRQSQKQATAELAKGFEASDDIEDDGDPFGLDDDGIADVNGSIMPNSAQQAALMEVPASKAVAGYPAN